MDVIYYILLPFLGVGMIWDALYVIYYYGDDRLLNYQVFVGTGLLSILIVLTVPTVIFFPLLLLLIVLLVNAIDWLLGR